MNITIDVPESAFSALRVSPAQFARDMTTAAVVKWYEMKKISQAKGAQMCNISRAEFIRTLSEYGVSVIQYDKDTLADELAAR